MNNREKLTEAARLIEEVKNALNTDEKTCPCCHLKAKENWSQHQVAERLAGLPTKLLAIAGGGAITELDGLTIAAATL